MSLFYHFKTKILIKKFKSNNKCLNWKFITNCTMNRVFRSWRYPSLHYYNLYSYDWLIYEKLDGNLLSAFWVKKALNF